MFETSRRPSQIQRTRHLTGQTLIGLAVGLFTALALPLQAAVISVGPEPDCDSTTLATALFGAGLNSEDDEIRLIGGTLSGIDLDLVNWNPATVGSLTIRGGFGSCSASEPVGRTTIEADLSGPIFHIRHDAGSASAITLDGLILSGANNSHAVVVEGSEAELSMTFSDIILSDGGLRISDEATVTLDSLTKIEDNDVGTGTGGGVLCESGGYLSTAAFVTDNHAGVGGGIFAGTDCDVVLLPGARISLNQALFGGGAAVRDPGTTLVSLGSNPSQRVTFNSNVAATRGGGLWVNFDGGVVLLESEITQNRAGEKGGGAYVDNGGVFLMARGDSFCAREPRCSRLWNNSLDTEDEGSAVWAGGGAEVQILQTYVEAHTSPAQSSALFFATGSDTLLRVASSQIWDNDTSALFNADDSAEVSAEFVSADANRWRILPNTVIDSRGAIGQNGANISIEAGVLQRHSEFTASGGASISASCSYLSTETGLASADDNLVGNNPGFLFAAIGDLRTYADAAVVDRCEQSTHLRGTVVRDLLHQPREHDEPNVPNAPGEIADMGAFEAWGMFFADSFETGSTSRWSSSVP